MKLCKNPACKKPNPTRASTCSYECKLAMLKAKKTRAKWVKSRGITEAKCDALWSKIVRSKGVCEYCGETKNLNAHHIYGRRNFSVRWDVENGCALCSKCHQFSNVFSAHQTPTEFTHWITENRGEEFMQRLKEKARIIGKPDIEEVYKQLKELESTND